VSTRLQIAARLIPIFPTERNVKGHVLNRDGIYLLAPPCEQKEHLIISVGYFQRVTHSRVISFRVYIGRVQQIVYFENCITIHYKNNKNNKNNKFIIKIIKIIKN